MDFKNLNTNSNVLILLFKIIEKANSFRLDKHY